MVILLISTKLVLACQSVICSNGVESNICAIGYNEIAAQRYFNLSLSVFIIVSILYFILKRKGIFTVIFCFLAVSVPNILRYFSGGGSCNFFATSVAIWLFYSSLLIFIFQIILWTIQIKKLKIKLL